MIVFSAAWFEKIVWRILLSGWCKEKSCTKSGFCALMKINAKKVLIDVRIIHFLFVYLQLFLDLINNQVPI